MLYPANSILAADLSPFGQSLALLPVARALRASYPRALIVGAAANGTGELLAASGFVDETIPLGVIKHSDDGKPGGLKRLVGLAKRARGSNFDVVLDFTPTLETLFVSRVLLRSRVFSPARLPRILRSFLDFRRPSSDEQRSDYQNVLQQLGVQLIDTRFAITPSAEEDAKFEDRLAASGSRVGKLIVLIYTSGLGIRSWPVGAFGEIGSRLSNNFDARIVAADEPGSRQFSSSVSLLLPSGAIQLSEPRALELVAAIARSSIVITDDNGIAQMAGELSTPVIEVSEAAAAKTPFSATHRVAQAAVRSKISAEEVYEIAVEMIQENRSSSLFQRH